MKQPKISDVLWLAANKHLLPPTYDWNYSDAALASCCAVSCSLRHYGYVGMHSSDDSSDATDFDKSVMRFLVSLGCPVNSMRAFPASWTDEQRQGTRYAWLMLAAQVARERGL